jgi:hypothetical protein
MTKATLASLFLCLCLASPVSAGPPQLVIVGDSWACRAREGVKIYKRAVSVVCEEGTTTIDWLETRHEWLPELPPNATVVFSVGGLDAVNWLAEGREDDSKWAPRRVLRRTRMLTKLLQRAGHKVRFMEYVSQFHAAHLNLLPQGYVVRFVNADKQQLVRYHAPSGADTLPSLDPFRHLFRGTHVAGLFFRDLL